MDTLSSLIERRAPVSPQSSCADVAARFLAEPDALLLAVTEDCVPVGLIARDVALALAADPRPVREVMDRRPMVAPAEMTAQALRDHALATRPEALARGFIAVEDGLYLGVGHPLMLLGARRSGPRTPRGSEAELISRGAWARCIQIIGALDAAVEFSVAHTREREQFGRPLSAFQAVQHTLAAMAGEVERARAATDLAVAAAADFGFGSPQTDYAVMVAKVTLGQVVPIVVTAAHQLHGAIGVTIEHRLWLATMRARSWIDEFGDTAHYAQRLGRLALSGADPWDVMIGVTTESHA